MNKKYIATQVALQADQASALEQAREHFKKTHGIELSKSQTVKMLAYAYLKTVGEKCPE